MANGNGDTNTTNIDITRVSAKLPTIASVVAVVLAIAGSYFSTSAKLDSAAREISQLRADNSTQHTAIMGQVTILETRNREQERLIVELSTTLRVKGIIR